MNKGFLAFSKRNIKEIIRDPLNVAFGLGFPVVLMVLLTAIQANIPVDLFSLNNLTPGVAVFSLSFVTLFSGTLIAKDRSSSFLMRLFASPLSALDFILGYTLPMLPVAVLQSVICYLLALVLGMEFTPNIFVALLTLIPSMAFFIGTGLLCGTALNDKQVGGVCGALLTNLCGWLSGTWFDLQLVGGVFKKCAELLPFYHAVEAGRAAISGDFSSIFPHLLWVCGYAVAVLAVAVALFGKKMKGKKT